jgi:hypothetical protein
MSDYSYLYAKYKRKYLELKGGRKAFFDPKKNYYTDRDLLYETVKTPIGELGSQLPLILETLESYLSSSDGEKNVLELISRPTVEKGIYDYYSRNTCYQNEEKKTLEFNNADGMIKAATTVDYNQLKKMTSTRQGLDDLDGRTYNYVVYYEPSKKSGVDLLMGEFKNVFELGIKHAILASGKKVLVSGEVKIRVIDGRARFTYDINSSRTYLFDYTRAPKKTDPSDRRRIFDELDVDDNVVLENIYSGIRSTMTKDLRDELDRLSGNERLMLLRTFYFLIMMRIPKVIFDHFGQGRLLPLYYSNYEQFYDKFIRRSSHSSFGGVHDYSNYQCPRSQVIEKVNRYSYENQGDFCVLKDKSTLTGDTDVREHCDYVANDKW